MQQVVEKVNKFSEKQGIESPNFLGNDLKDLHQSALVFSQMALNNYQGKLLKKALNISCAIVEFVSELDINIKEVL